VPLVAQHVGGEPLAEEVALAPMAAVEAERVDAVQAFHAVRESLLRGFDDEVVVRSHQAMRVDVPAVLSRGCAEQRQEVQAVEVDDEDVSAACAMRGDVEIAVRELASREPRHDGDRTRRHELELPSRPFRHTADTKQ
jgi:hypothetical protein